MRAEIISLGVILIFIGIVLVFVGMLSEVTSSKEIEKRGAGIVMIGPFPIIFGTDTESVRTVVVLAIILIITAFFFMTWWNK